MMPRRDHEALVSRGVRRHADGLGLRRALSRRLLPCLVAAMTLLAALALAGAVAAAGLAVRWQSGAGGLVTVQVPQPDAPATGQAGSRADAVLAALTGLPDTASAHRLGVGEVSALLRPWLGDAADAALALPAVIQLQLAATAADDWSADIGRRLQTVAPGTLVERNAAWLGRLSALARSLQACAAACLVLVIATAAAVIAVATRAGLSSRREAIGIVHGLGASDGYVAGRFAGRATRLAASGSVAGLAVALPVLLGLAGLAEPFAAAGPSSAAGVLGILPGGLWLALACLPPAAAAIGWLTAQATVRRWLQRLP